MPLDDPLLHLSRAAGLGAYLILWADMCLGVALTGWLSLPFLSRWRIGDLHQFTGMLGLSLLATHVGVLVGLRNQPFTAYELLVPLAREINPAAPLLGISALYVLLLVTAVSRARRWVPLRLWRLVHTLSFAGFALSLAHAVMAGPDGSIGWIRAMYVSSVLVLLTLTGLRIRRLSTLRTHVGHVRTSAT
jgi:methionine sulfoxide reductase heme-binding subunit